MVVCIGIALLITAVAFILDKVVHTDIAGLAICVDIFLLILAGMVYGVCSYEASTLKELSKNKSVMTNVMLSKYNTGVAEFKAHKLLYFGVNTEGLEYISPSEIESLKVEVSK